LSDSKWKSTGSRRFPQVRAHLDFADANSSQWIVVNCPSDHVVCSCWRQAAGERNSVSQV
jgi:hypothetical protein